MKKNTRYLVLGAGISFLLILVFQLGGSHSPSVNDSSSDSSSELVIDKETLQKIESAASSLTTPQSVEEAKKAIDVMIDGCKPASSATKQVKACKNCRTWPSFFSERSREHCAPVLNSIESIAPFDLERIRKNDVNDIFHKLSDSELTKRRTNFLKDRRPSAPFITGDGFRAASKFIFDETTVATWDKLNLKTVLKDFMMKEVAKNGAEGEDAVQKAHTADLINLGKILPSCHDLLFDETTQKVVVDEKHESPTPMYMSAPRSPYLASKESYWERVTKKIVDLSENSFLQRHSDVMNYLRFDCLQYSDPIFVQTHLLDKFIDEALPLLEQRYKIYHKNCEENVHGVDAYDKQTHCSNEATRDRILKNYYPGFVLITHNSDYSSPWDPSSTRGIKSDPENAKFDKQIQKLLKSPILIKWFGQNLVLSPERQRKLMEELEVQMQREDKHEKNGDENLSPEELAKKHLREQAALREKLKNDPMARMRQDKPLPGNQDLYYNEQKRKHVDNYGNRDQNVLVKNYVEDPKIVIDPDNLFPNSLQKRDQERMKYMDKKEALERGPAAEGSNQKQQQQQQSHGESLTPNDLFVKSLFEEQEKLLDGTSSSRRFLEAKLIPLPIGIENRYNKYGKFVSSDYSIAAGCFDVSYSSLTETVLVDKSGGDSSTKKKMKKKKKRKNRENNVDLLKRFSKGLDREQQGMEDFVGLPRNNEEPFVAFSVKTNKREREDAIKAVEENFNSGGGTAGGSPPKKKSRLSGEQAEEQQEEENVSTTECIERMLRFFSYVKKSGARFSAQQYPSLFNADVAAAKNSKDKKNQATLSTYLAKLKCYGFTMSPHGHGMDTHRVWEALYAGSIPIVAPSPLDRQLLSQLPVFISSPENQHRNLHSSSTSSSSLLLPTTDSLSSPPVSYHYKIGTFSKYVTKENLNNFWCKTARGVVQQTLYGNALEEKQELDRLIETGKQENKWDGRSGYQRGLELFFKYSWHLPAFPTSNDVDSDSSKKVLEQQKMYLLQKSILHSLVGNSQQISITETGKQKQRQDQQKLLLPFPESSTPLYSRFNYDLLDMSFWTMIVTMEHHPHREMGGWLEHL